MMVNKSVFLGLNQKKKENKKLILLFGLETFVKKSLNNNLLKLLNNSEKLLVLVCSRKINLIIINKIRRLLIPLKMDKLTSLYPKIAKKLRLWDMKILKLKPCLKIKLPSSLYTKILCKDKNSLKPLTPIKKNNYFLIMIFNNNNYIRIVSKIK